eukprot:g17595.t1
MGTAHSVKEYGAGASGLNDTTDPGLQEGSLVTPEPWDSSLCMEHWGRSELLTEMDPNGYVVFVSGAEQLGGNKYLMADGLFIAKMLGRTLVEYPAKDARISVANATLGLGAYWDLSAMCMNHRILDLRAFRGLVERGLIPPEEFITIETWKQQGVTTKFKHSADVKEFYEGKMGYKVIVMERTWKSHLHRRSMAYLHPNPFYRGVARMLLLQQRDYKNGKFIAVQWRTETATGDMAHCYEEVRSQVEEHRIRLGLTREQVIFSTDMYGSTSGTYKKKKQQQIGGEAIKRIQEDYPKALDNPLHDFFNGITDTGVKAIVSGLVIAQAQVLLASSLNHWTAKDIPGSSVCQKPFSGYVELIAEWRTELFRKPPETVVRLFPFGEMIVEPVATSTDSDNVVELDGEGAMIEVQEDSAEEGGGVEGKAGALVKAEGAVRGRRLGDVGQGGISAVDRPLLSHLEVSSTPDTSAGSVGQVGEVRSRSRR